MKRILLPIDFSDTTSKIVNLGVEIAKKFNSEIILVHVESPEPDFVGYEPGPQVQRDSVAKKIHSN